MGSNPPEQPFFFENRKEGYQVHFFALHLKSDVHMFTRSFQPTLPEVVALNP